MILIYDGVDSFYGSFTGGVIPTTQFRTNYANAKSMMNTSNCLFYHKLKILKQNILWMQNPNLGFLDLRVAGCDLHLQNVEFRWAITWTHPKLPVDTERAIQHPHGWKLDQNTQKNILLHHFFSPNTPLLAGTTKKLQLQIVIAQLPWRERCSSICLPCRSLLVPASISKDTHLRLP